MDFEKELFRISDKYVRDLTRKALQEAPEYFWTKPSSSSGKYHLPDEHGEGGLVKHVKRTCAAAEVLLKAWVTPVDFDVVRAGCILHDIGRYGFTEEPPAHSLKTHPYLGWKYLNDIEASAEDTKFKEVIHCVESHMGKWGPVSPGTREAFIVHLADMIASQYREEVL